MISGQEKLRIFRDTDTASGTPLDRYFCTVCGSNVILATGDPEKSKRIVIVALGTLDEDIHWCKLPLAMIPPLDNISLLVPKEEFFPEQKRHWVAGINKTQTKAKL
ncbi:hypothetical protein AN958_10499 [Leucoagaricus sp. SymC.cos]|nr:hypothetical protein AN958_10499 [Leucoagaricus sp. SymC.cos]